MFEIDDQPKLAKNENNRWFRPVLEFIKERGITYDVGSHSFFEGRTNLTRKDLALQAKVNLRYGTKVMSLLQATAVVDDVMKEMRKQAVTQLADKIVAGDRTDDSELRRWLKEMVEWKSDEKFELHVAVMKHWIWLVQRQIMGLPTSWHMMPIFWGGQGGGKSVQIERLLKPLGSFADKATFAIFSDPFGAKTMHYTFALFLDEMAGVSRADAGRIKTLISSDYIGGRNMHSDDPRKLARNASFIAATNDPEPHGLGDTTGNRRFFSIECKSTRVVGARKELFDSIDYMKIWKCVDYQSAPLTLPLLHEVEVAQAETALEDPFKEFMDQCTEFDPASSVKAGVLQRRYKEFCSERGWFARVPQQKELRRLVERYVDVQTVNSKNVLTFKGLRLIDL